MYPPGVSALRATLACRPKGNIMNLKTDLVVAASARALRRDGEIVSPDPPPGKIKTADERMLWDYICAHLRQAGLDHATAGLAIERTVFTYLRLEAATELCDRDGRYQTSKTGWSTPTPWADDEKRLTMELMQWLPKLCLTLPALAKARKDMGDNSKQDDLFGDLVNHATRSPARSSMN